MDNVKRTRFAVPLILLLVMLAGVPAFAQIDFAGEWATTTSPQRSLSAVPGDWFGIPMNDAARTRAETWSESVQTLPEWQCRPHGAGYITMGASPLKIFKEIDPVSRELVAYHTEFLRTVDNPIYMDGRPHPPEYAPHTWAGFSTGEYIGNMLKITTTHIKEGYLERNGIPNSDLMTATQYWIRNEDYLTWVIVFYDPVYLTEPLIRSTEFRVNLQTQMAAYPCDVVEEVDRPKGTVPHFLPGKNEYLNDFTKKLGLQEQLIWAGSETMYPEFRSKIKRTDAAK